MKCYNYANWMYVSIHASVKDATYFQKVFLPYLGVSIHASVKDATPISIHQRSRSSFNPRICKRCDDMAEWYNRIERVSIHASVKDATHCQ